MSSTEKKTLERQRQELSALDTGIRSQLPTDAYRRGLDQVDFSGAPWRKTKTEATP